MTRNQINDLRDLWEGCFDFETAVAMVGSGVQPTITMEAEYKEALKHWNSWNRKFEASQMAW